MKIDKIDKLKEKDHIVLLPEPDFDIKESVEYSFNNVVFLDYTPTEEETQKLIDTVNKKNLQLILFDYNDFYRQVLPYIHKNRKIKWILKNGLASMTDGAVRATFINLMEFCDRDMINCIGCLDFGAYKVLENAGYNACHIILDIEEKSVKPKKSKSIGIIGNDYNPNHNTYNQLTAVTLVDYDYAQKLNETPGVVKCHIKVDTGLNRFGHKVTEIDIFKKMFELKNLNILGIFSHLCRETEFTDEANEFSKNQIKY